jgi:hypothetical protein
MKLRMLEDELAVIRLGPDADVPLGLADGSPLFNVTRTGAELSIVCANALARGFARAQRGLRAIKVDQPLDFAMTGVLASLVGPLADAGVPIFVVSTFDTDYVLVPAATLAAARDALIAAGHTFND